jgi:hypothetical protein
MRKPYLPSEHSTEYGMNLPEGMTCGDCCNFDKCSKLCGQIAEDRICDWSPSRFVRELPTRLHVNDDKPW